MQSYYTVPKHITLYLCIGIALGMLCGFFYGIDTEILLPFESTFNMLLQTIIVLYIPLALMYGVSNLHAKEAGRLLLKAGFFILLLWIAILSSCFLAILFIPEASPALIDLKPQTHGIYEKLLEYLVPENPFYDAIHNVLPPLAIFSLLLGVAYMRSKDKEPFLDVISVSNHLLEIMLVWIAYMSPVLAFFHTAVIVGTLDFAIWKPLAFYIVTMIATCLFFTLFFLPMLVSMLTPLPYRVLLRRFAFIGLASLGTGQTLIVIPFIAHVLRNIRLNYHFPFRDWRATFLMITPLSFSFAQLGSVLSFFFVCFFGYFFHTYFTPIQKFILPFFSIVVSISSPASGQGYLEVLIKQFQLPEETIFFIPKLNNYTHNFKILFNSAGVLSLILIVMMLHEMKLKKIGKKAAAFLAVSAILLASIYFTIHRFLPAKESYREFIVPRSLSDSLPNLPTIHVLETKENLAPSPPDEGTILSKVLSRRKLTVAFDPDNAPYSYFDVNGCIAGFDIAFMAQFAYDLNIDLELVPIQFDTLEQNLNDGHFDIAVGGIMMDFSRILRLSFTDFYREEYNVLITARENASKYENLHRLEDQRDLKVGARGIFVRLAKDLFPSSRIYSNATWTDLMDNTVDLFLEGKTTSILWALKHPSIVGLDFGEVLGKEYVCYALPLKDQAWKRFVNQWLSLYKLSGFYDKQYDYWFIEESL